ncbi:MULTISPECIES: sugar MFS transporter [unclassified Dysgonomonas]|uniref:sugar MFS transporter n=1 Tax=unclassified Dysgonomonas TaxID=2630389 RepID=UPI0025C1330B|nr:MULTISPECIES: sugar MFS transporter [unclassified Dysgonomonas]HMM03162.1 sugar MFS transporter [Dysgonomonas sp.]
MEKHKKKKLSLFASPGGGSYLIPFILVSSLFLMWGIAHGLLDVLNKHFQEAFTMTKAQSGFVQFSTYIAYGLMSVPAGMFMRRFGYKKGIIFGLLIYAVGSFSFLPAAYLHSANPFFIALFVVACGLCFLETAANPYSTVLGPKERGAQRLNLSQSLNGLGWILGPLIGGALIFGAEEGDTLALTKPYILLGICTLVITVLFFFVKLPDIQESDEEVVQEIAEPGHDNAIPLFQHRHFVLAIAALVAYMMAQSGIFGFFINYVMEQDHNISKIEATQLLSFGGMLLFMIGRLSGSFIMAKFKPQHILSLYALMCTISMVLVILSLGKISLYALYINFFFMSIMFPTIYALGLVKMGEHTKRAASFLTMAVAGGAFSPIIMGALGEENMAIGFFIPLACFLFILYFGLHGYKPAKN